MAFRPGWDTLDGAVRAHRIFEGCAQVAGVLVVTLGLTSFFYGRRKDELKELASNQQLQTLRMEAEARVSRAEAEAAARVAAVDAKYAPRRLTKEQQVALQGVLVEHAGTPIRIHSVSGDAETATFGIHLAEVFSAARWPAEHENMAFFGAPHGLQVRCPGKTSTPKEVPETSRELCPGAAVLHRALVTAGQQAKLMIWPPGDPEDKGITLVVGYKP
jgi:hypothetical protein